MTLGPIPVLLLFAMEGRHRALTRRRHSRHINSCPPEPQDRRRIGCERRVNGGRATIELHGTCRAHLRPARDAAGVSNLDVDRTMGAGAKMWAGCAGQGSRNLLPCLAHVTRCACHITRATAGSLCGAGLDIGIQPCLRMSLVSRFAAPILESEVIAATPNRVLRVKKAVAMGRASRTTPSGSP